MHRGLVLALLILFIAKGAQAAPITYTIAPFYTRNHGLAEGVITTDGTMGLLTLDNIIKAGSESYCDLFVIDTGPTYTEIDQPYLEGAMMATETELFLPYALEQTNLFALETWVGYSAQWETYSPLGISIRGIEINGGLEHVELPLGDLVIATVQAVPEPSAMSLLALGGMAMLLRRFRMR